MKPSVDQVAAAYEMLRVSAPYRAWKLPHGDEIEFKVTRHRDRFGHWSRYKRTNEHIIVISETLVTDMSLLLLTVAHEMIHLKQDIDKTDTRGNDHNAQFVRLAKRVSRCMGWQLDSLL